MAEHRGVRPQDRATTMCRPDAKQRGQKDHGDGEKGQKKPCSPIRGLSATTLPMCVTESPAMRLATSRPISKSCSNLISRRCYLVRLFGVGSSIDWHFFAGVHLSVSLGDWRTFHWACDSLGRRETRIRREIRLRLRCRRPRCRCYAGHRHALHCVRRYARHCGSYVTCLTLLQMR